MRVQIVRHQHNHFSVRVDLIGQEFQKPSEIQFRSSIRDLHHSCPSQWLERHEDVRASLPCVLVILSFYSTRFRWNAPSGCASQFLLAFVHAHHWTLWIERAFIHTEHVFHFRYEVRVRFGNAVAFDRPGFGLIFFSRSPSVVRPTLGSNPSATTWFFSSESVQRAAPLGGSLHARSRIFASISPVIFGIAPGRGFSSSAACKPSSAYRLQMR
jgi:hypothetical protein